MMNRTWRNRIAWLLLLAYLPMLLASALHVHHQPAVEEFACFDCAHHIAHPAHFGEYRGGEQSCLYCHILSLPNLAAWAMALATVVLAATRIGMPTVAVAACRPCGQVRLRAPPVLL